MPLGGRFGGAGDTPTPTPIDPEVDEVRNDIVQDLIYSQFVSRIGSVKGVVPSPTTELNPTPGATGFRTDGLRAVLFFDREPVSLDQVGFLDWEVINDTSSAP